MDVDEFLPKKSRDLLGELMRQDLDPLSVTELEERIAALQAEIERARTKMQRAVNHRASADELFKR